MIGNIHINDIYHSPMGPVLLLITDIEPDNGTTQFGKKHDRIVTVRVYVQENDAQPAKYLETTECFLRWTGKVYGRLKDVTNLTPDSLSSENFDKL